MGNGEMEKETERKRQFSWTVVMVVSTGNGAYQHRHPPRSLLHFILLSSSLSRSIEQDDVFIILDRTGAATKSDR